jgi:hypothetical protein
VKALLPLTALLLGGCAMLGPAAPTASPPTPTATPGATATASPTPTEAEPTPEAPPPASLVLADGTEHDGEIGSSCYRGACADGPWLPAPALQRVELGDADDQLLIRLASGFEFVRWTARYAAAGDTQADVIYPLDDGGAEDGSDLFSEVSFDAPPSGEWVLSVGLVFSDEDGDAAYYWYLVVP